MQHRFHRPLQALAVVTLAAGLAVCGEPAGTTKNPVPVLESLEPGQLVTHSFSRFVRIRGSGFVAGSRVLWKGVDHDARFQSSSELTVDLDAADLVTEGVLEISVYNPGPGGGVSNSLPLAVGFPKPTLTSVSPSSITVGESPTLILAGAGFVTESRVYWNDGELDRVYVSATELHVTLPGGLLRAHGTGSIRVSNRGPAGGTSETREVWVVVPVPRITSLSPTSAITGKPFTLNVSGSGFIDGSILRWNGEDRPTTYLSSHGLQLSMTGSDVPVQGTYSVTVFTPSPGGGVSEPATFVVADAKPSIVFLFPGWTYAATPGFRLSVNGGGFNPSSTVLWNGAARATQFIDEGNLTADILAADIAEQGSAQVSVSQPSGVSPTRSFEIREATGGFDAPVIVPLANNFLVYDHTRNIFYAAVPSVVAGRGNSITKVDANGVIGASVVVGSEPSRMAMADDGRYLYVTLGGSPSVVRVDLATFTKDIEFLLAQGTTGPLYGKDIEVLPGLAQTVVVARTQGVAVYDDGVARPLQTPPGYGSTRLARSVDASRVFGFDHEAEFKVRRLAIVPTGVQEEAVQSGLVPLHPYLDFEHDGGRLYFTSATVVDPYTMTRVGNYPPPAYGPVRPDIANGRVHFITNNEVRTYDAITFAYLGRFIVNELPEHAYLIRWGSDGLAAGGGANIILLRGPRVRP